MTEASIGILLRSRGRRRGEGTRSRCQGRGLPACWLRRRYSPGSASEYTCPSGPTAPPGSMTSPSTPSADGLLVGLVLVVTALEALGVGLTVGLDRRSLARRERHLGVLVGDVRLLDRLLELLERRGQVRASELGERFAGVVLVRGPAVRA